VPAELHALPAETVEIGRGKLPRVGVRGAVEADVCPSDVVSEENDDVGPGAESWRRRRRGRNLGLAPATPGGRWEEEEGEEEEEGVV